MIASGWEGRRYPNAETGNHTAIYLGPGRKKGFIRILSQNKKSVNKGCVGVEEVPGKGWSTVTSNSKSDRSGSECTIQTCTKDGTVINTLTWKDAKKLYNIKP